MVRAALLHEIVDAASDKCSPPLAVRFWEVMGPSGVCEQFWSDHGLSGSYSESEDPLRGVATSQSTCLCSRLIGKVRTRAVALQAERFKCRRAAPVWENSLEVALCCRLAKLI